MYEGVEVVEVGGMVRTSSLSAKRTFLPFERSVRAAAAIRSEDSSQVRGIRWAAVSSTSRAAKVGADPQQLGLPGLLDRELLSRVFSGNEGVVVMALPEMTERTGVGRWELVLSQLWEDASDSS